MLLHQLPPAPLPSRTSIWAALTPSLSYLGWASSQHWPSHRAVRASGMLAVVVGQGRKVPQEPNSVASGPVTECITPLLGMCRCAAGLCPALGQGSALNLASQLPTLGDTCPQVTAQQGPDAAIQLLLCLQSTWRSHWEARPLPSLGFLADRLLLGHSLVCPAFPKGPARGSLLHFSSL